MSVFRPEVIVCPACGHRNEEMVAVSLNGPRVPAVVEAIVAGTFQCFTCAGCGLPYRADGPVLYIDFDRKHWVGEMPAAMEPSWTLLEQQPLDSFRQSIIDLAPAFLRSEAAGFTVRAVFGLDALAEKIRLLDAGLDDRAVEVAKLATLLQMKAVVDPAFRPRVVEADADAVSIVVWRHPDGEGGGDPVQEHVRIAVDEVTRLAADPGWATALLELSVGPYVDLGRLFIDGRTPLQPLPA